MKDRLGILVCEHLEKETRAVLEMEGPGNVICATFPCVCGRGRLHSWADLTSIAASQLSGCRSYLLIGGDCCRTLGEPPAGAGQWQVLAPELCAYLVAPRSLVDAETSRGGFVMTPGWLSTWRRRIEEWGFHLDIARQSFGETVSRLVLLDTGVSSQSPKDLDEFSAQLGLPSLILPVGLDLLREKIARLLSEVRRQPALNQARRDLAEVRGQVAEFAMALDLVRDLATAASEAQALDRFRQLLITLFTPSSITFTECSPPVQHPISQSWSPGSARTRSPDESMRVAVVHQGELLGAFELAGLAFPERLDHYLGLIPMLGQVCGLTVSNARRFQQVLEASQALEAERENLAVTLRGIGDGVIATDVEGRVTLMNPVAERLTGWLESEAVGCPLETVFNIVNETTGARHEDLATKVLSAGAAVGLANHTTLISRDGTRRSIADSGAPILSREGGVQGVILVFQDITDRVRMEEALLRARRLESVGVLAGGIAHDFNNLLTAIVGNTSVAKVEVGQGSPAYARLEDAEKACLRAEGLARQLLTFSKGGAPVKRLARLNPLVREAVDFALTGSACRVEYLIPEESWGTEVDEGQINQVFTNLAINARQAMGSRGTITVDAENLLVTEGTGLPLKPGAFVRISVSDQGIGISPENLDRVFDPYFTTKSGGNGLGLTVCHSIVAKHGGHIEAKSTPGKGSTFSVYIPAEPSARFTNVPRVGQQVETQVTIADSGRRILVMDDDEMVRTVAGKMLAALGYSVDFALDGEQAIQMYQREAEAGRHYDAVIMDLTIPGGMGGQETVGRLLAKYPEAKAIVSSGYSNSAAMSTYQSLGFVGAMRKPYRLGEMSKVLSEVPPFHQSK